MAKPLSAAEQVVLAWQAQRELKRMQVHTRRVKLPPAPDGAVQRQR